MLLNADALAVYLCFDIVINKVDVGLYLMQLVLGCRVGDIDCGHIGKISAVAVVLFFAEFINQFLCSFKQDRLLCLRRRIVEDFKAAYSLVFVKIVVVNDITAFVLIEKNIHAIANVCFVLNILFQPVFACVFQRAVHLAALIQILHFGNQGRADRVFL